MPHSHGGGAGYPYRQPVRHDEECALHPGAPPHHHHHRSNRSNHRINGSGEGKKKKKSKSPRGRPRYHRVQNHISPCLKCLLFSFNFLFWLIGTGIACLGFWIIIEKGKEVRDVLDFFFDPSILMSLAGGIIFSLGFFGCLGALRENICLLKTFHILLTILLLLELVLGILIFVFYYVPGARRWLGWFGPEETLKEAIIRYRDDDDLRDMIDTIQREFQCCGVSNNDLGYRDWQQNIYFNCSRQNPSVERCGVPHSCCITKPGDLINVMCGFGTTSEEKTDIEEKIYVQGCLQAFGAWLERNTIIIGAVCLGVILPQILGICLARGLIEQIEQQKAQWR